MSQKKKIIAIDPDCDKSGVASIEQGSSISIQSLRFPELIGMIGEAHLTHDISVLVEAGWMNQSNWHISRSSSNRKAAAMGNHVGRNHEVGRKIIEMCEWMGVDVKPIKPLMKIWKGRDRKITHDEISRMIRDFPKRSNQEERDAALILFVNNEKLFKRITNEKKEVQ